MLHDFDVSFVSILWEFMRFMSESCRFRYSDQAWQMDAMAMRLLSLEVLYKHGGFHVPLTCQWSKDGATMKVHLSAFQFVCVSKRACVRAYLCDAFTIFQTYAPQIGPQSKECGDNVAGMLVIAGCIFDTETVFNLRGPLCASLCRYLRTSLCATLFVHLLVDLISGFQINTI